MGWCSGTQVFDPICEALFGDEPLDRKALLKEVIDALESNDWDCQQDSAYWDHPLVQEVMRELHPSWFEDDK